MPENPMFSDAIDWELPFAQHRLIGTIRREYLDHTLFWNERDLHKKLNSFKLFYNEKRTHSSLNANTPSQMNGSPQNKILPFRHFKWKSHCNGLFQLPIAA